MVLNVVCPQGHRLQAKAAHAGRKGRCPVCSERVMIPEPRPTPAGLSDTGALRILGDYTPPPTAPRRETLSTGSGISGVMKRTCPRCRASLRSNISVCDQCQTFVGRR